MIGPLLKEAKLRPLCQLPPDTFEEAISKSRNFGISEGNGCSPSLMRFLLLSHVFLLNRLQRLRNALERREEEMEFLRGDSSLDIEAADLASRRRIRKKKDAV